MAIPPQDSFQSLCSRPCGLDQGTQSDSCIHKAPSLPLPRMVLLSLAFTQLAWVSQTKYCIRSAPLMVNSGQFLENSCQVTYWPQGLNRPKTLSKNWIKSIITNVCPLIWWAPRCPAREHLLFVCGHTLGACAIPRAAEQQPGAGWILWSRQGKGQGRGLCLESSSFWGHPFLSM